MTASETRIRQITDADWPIVWTMMKPVIRAGETCPYACDMSDTAAQKVWLEIPETSYVAEDESGKLPGTYYIKPNQPTLGAHVANCGYILSEYARGCGVVSRMCEHSRAEAVRLGYRAMQYNRLVKTNASGVYLWKKMGFEVTGTLPGAFQHPVHGYVDAFVMFKELLK